MLPFILPSTTTPPLWVLYILQGVRNVYGVRGISLPLKIAGPKLQRSKPGFLYNWYTGENPKLQIYKELGVPRRTASYWLKQRALLGSPAIRRTRPRSQVIGGKSALAHADYSILLLPSNPVSRGSYITA